MPNSTTCLYQRREQAPEEREATVGFYLPIRDDCNSLIPIYSPAGSNLATRGSLRIANSKGEADVQPELLALPDNWQDIEPSVLTKRRRITKSSEQTKPANSSGSAGQVVSTSEIRLDASNARDRPKTLAADSSRNLHASLDVLESVLGRSVPGGHIKAGVMRFVSPDCEPKFSKYTGASEPVEARYFCGGF